LIFSVNGRRETELEERQEESAEQNDDSSISVYTVELDEISTEVQRQGSVDYSGNVQANPLQAWISILGSKPMMIIKTQTVQDYVSDVNGRCYFVPGASEVGGVVDGKTWWMTKHAQPRCLSLVRAGTRSPNIFG
jgi:hypothetical protein